MIICLLRSLRCILQYTRTPHQDYAMFFDRPPAGDFNALFILIIIHADTTATTAAAAAAYYKYTRRLIMQHRRSGQTAFPKQYNNIVTHGCILIFYVSVHVAIKYTYNIQWWTSTYFFHEKYF